MAASEQTPFIRVSTLRKYVQQQSGKRKVLLTSEFVTFLNGLVQRIVLNATSLDANKKGGVVNTHAKPMPPATHEPVLIRQLQVRELLERELGKSAKMGKDWFDQINAYLLRVIQKTLELESNRVKLIHFVTGDEKPPEPPTTPSAPDPLLPTRFDHEAQRTAVKFDGPREHYLLNYELQIGKHVISGSMRMFTGKSKERLQEWLTRQVEERFAWLGLPKPTSIVLLSVETADHRQEDIEE